MKYSAKLSELYDNLMGDYEYISHPTKTLVYEYTQKKKAIDLLELGCGTGNILKIFPKSFTLYGLDISPDMLAIAKKKVKRAKLFEADMSDFHIHKMFDVIICVFDSINHLIDFKKWKATFLNVSKHLKKDGIFVFDMNTVKRHDALAKLPAYVKKEQETLMAFRVLPMKKHVYLTRIEIFSHLNNDKVQLFEENIPEASYPTSTVTKELRKNFTIEKMVDPYRENVGKDTGRLFFVCKKK
jgi:SAM-dependent methyltransferase